MLVSLQTKLLDSLPLIWYRAVLFHSRKYLQSVWKVGSLSSQASHSMYSRQLTHAICAFGWLQDNTLHTTGKRITGTMGTGTEEGFRNHRRTRSLFPLWRWFSDSDEHGRFSSRYWAQSYRFSHFPVPSLIWNGVIFGEAFAITFGYPGRCATIRVMVWSTCSRVWCIGWLLIVCCCSMQYLCGSDRGCISLYSSSRRSHGHYFKRFWPLHATSSIQDGIACWHGLVQTGLGKSRKASSYSSNPNYFRAPIRIPTNRCTWRGQMDTDVWYLRVYFLDRCQSFLARIAISSICHSSVTGNIGHILHLVNSS